MSDNLTAIIICITCALGPTWIAFHYIAKLRAGRNLNAADAATIEQMTQTAQRLEQRVAMLEEILDTEVPAWRSNPRQLYRQAG